MDMDKNDWKELGGLISTVETLSEETRTLKESVEESHEKISKIDIRLVILMAIWQPASMPTK